METGRFKAHAMIAIVGLTGPALAVLIHVLAILSRPGYSPLRLSVSRLALGHDGWIQRTGLYFISIVVILFAIGLHDSIKSRTGFKPGIALLVLIGIGGILTAVFNTDLPGHGTTVEGMVHGFSSKVIALLFPVAVLLLAPSFKADPRWKGIFSYAIVTGVLGLALVVVGIVMRSRWTFFGLYERFLLGNGLLWITVISARLLGLEAGQQIEAVTAEQQQKGQA